MSEQHKTKKRKIAIIAGSRGEYGYFRPIIREIERRNSLDYEIIATNMHVLDAFGTSVNEIKRDNFKIHSEIHNTFDGYNYITMVKSLGVFMVQLPELLKQMGADIVLVSGDRGEQLVGAIVGAHMYLPVAHVQAGELSGNIDGVTRHAITKYAHIHFAANADAAERVRKMGEEEHRVHLVGAPMLDELVDGFFTPEEEIRKRFGITHGEPCVLFAYHSATEELPHLSENIDAALRAVVEAGHRTIIILNNSDAGSKIIRRKITEYRTPFMRIYPNLQRQDYAGLMNVCDVLVGNSSSGIIEAPTFGLPAVNIGEREKGRIRAANVLDVPHDKDAILEALRTALTSEFRARARACVNPYGDGKSSKRIVDLLETLVIDDKLLIKKITY